MEVDDDPRDAGDAVVTYAASVNWCKELLKRPVDDLATELLEREPYVVGVALHAAYEVRELLEGAGVEDKLVLKVTQEIIRSGAVCCELTRRGYGELLRGLIEPAEEAGGKGAGHE